MKVQKRKGKIIKLSLVVPNKLWEEIRAFCFKHKVSQNLLVNKSVEKYLDTNN